MHPWFLLAMAMSFAFADRLAGGDAITHLRSWLVADLALDAPDAPLVCRLLLRVLNVRAVAWASVALALILAGLGVFTPMGPSLAVLALGFAAWRWDGWTAFGGDVDPKTDAQRLGLFERHALAVPVFILPLLWLQHWSLWPGLGALLGLIVFAAFATLLGVVLAAEERPGVDVNAFVEPARGFALGGLLAVILS